MLKQVGILSLELVIALKVVYRIVVTESTEML